MTPGRRRFLILLFTVLAVPGVVWGPVIVDAIRGERTPAARTKPAAMGAVVDTIYIVDDEDRSATHSLAGDQSVTVIWFWSVMCPCVADCEERIRALLARYENDDLRFIAVDANPQDSRRDIELLRKKLGSPYEVLRDDDGRTIDRLGIEASASVAVLDGEGRLRYRGAIDDDLYEPTVSYIHRAVDAILAGETFAPTEVPPYGCQYPLAD